MLGATTATWQTSLVKYDLHNEKNHKDRLQFDNLGLK
jgi:hypothetical protein